MKLIALGEKKLENEEILRELVKGSLYSLKPSLVMSDFENGWGLLVAEEAEALAIPLMGVFPHGEVLGSKAYQAARKKALRGVSNKIVFEKDYMAFLKNPKPYASWVLSYSDAALCYIDLSRSSVAHSVMLSLRRLGRATHNLHWSQND
jgi:hypothetical protein